MCCTCRHQPDLCRMGSAGPFNRQRPHPCLRLLPHHTRLPPLGMRYPEAAIPQAPGQGTPCHREDDHRNLYHERLASQHLASISLLNCSCSAAVTLNLFNCSCSAAVTLNLFNCSCSAAVTLNLFNCSCSAAVTLNLCMQTMCGRMSRCHAYFGCFWKGESFSTCI